jgi:5-formyltetrahydrofolate cyclo-ligase
MKTQKESMRLMIWNMLIEKDLVKHDCKGRIPNFEGSDLAAEILRSTIEWKTGQTIFVSPDTAQIKVRENVLKEGKVLIMPSPKLLNGFIMVKSIVEGHEKEASTIKGAFKYGKIIESIPEVDMVVEGSVAVDAKGGRLGKGGGYGDMEIELLKKHGSITEQTPVVSTVHEQQIVDKVPQEPHDEKINMVVTPHRILRINR